MTSPLSRSFQALAERVVTEYRGALGDDLVAIALFGSQVIIGLPGRVFTLPTRIYALFDYPPQYGLASAMSLIDNAMLIANEIRKSRASSRPILAFIRKATQSNAGHKM